MTNQTKYNTQLRKEIRSRLNKQHVWASQQKIYPTSCDKAGIAGYHVYYTTPIRKTTLEYCTSCNTTKVRLDFDSNLMEEYRSNFYCANCNKITTHTVRDVEPIQPYRLIK